MYTYIINPLENNHIDGSARNNKVQQTVIHFLGLFTVILHVYDYR